MRCLTRLKPAAVWCVPNDLSTGIPMLVMHINNKLKGLISPKTKIFFSSSEY